jgi:hypothetical protein
LESWLVAIVFRTVLHKEHSHPAGSGRIAKESADFSMKSLNGTKVNAFNAPNDSGGRVRKWLFLVRNAADAANCLLGQ